MKKLLLFCSIAIAALCSRASAYGENAVSFSLPQSAFTGVTFYNGVDGFRFVPLRDITVVALGWYDQNGDGLNQNGA